MQITIHFNLCYFIFTTHVSIAMLVIHLPTMMELLRKYLMHVMVSYEIVQFLPNSVLGILTPFDPPKGLLYDMQFVFLLGNRSP